MRTTLITWECTKRHRISWAQIERWAVADTPRARFFAAITAKSVRTVQAGERAQSPDGGWVACDPLALACALWPRLVQDAERCHCMVELQV
jgi:purine nucleosidase